MLEDTQTMVFGSEKMFSCFETIFSKAETVVEVPGTVFPVIETVVSTIKAMVFLAGTTVCGTKTLFSEAVPIFYTSETDFSITEKIVGKVSLAKALSKEIASAEKEPHSKPNDWAIQSWQYAKANAYPGIPSASGSKIVATLDAKYEKQATPILRQQLARAGVHLAQFLTEHKPKAPPKK